MRPSLKTWESVMFDQARHFINGKWQEPTQGQTLPVINPSTGEPFGKIAKGSTEDIDKAVKAARAAFKGEWSQLTPTERGRLLKRFSEIILKHTDKLTELEVSDVGKPTKQARTDVEACARYFEYYGEACDKVLGQTIPFQAGYTVLTFREAHGVTGHIVPWNYPMQIMGRSVAAALAMGNTCVVKPAEDASLTALYLAQLSEEAGLPAGVLNVVTGSGEEAGTALTAHTEVNHISFTGSTTVGKKVQSAAAQNTVPVTLELGGKSPQLVFADADLKKALPFLVNAFIQNAGQTCSAASRLIVQDSIYEKLMQMLAEKVLSLKVGPASANLDIGPVVNKKQMDKIKEMIARGKKDGLKVVAEGSLEGSLPAQGCYVAPIVFGDVPPEHPLAQEEIFGPVLVVIRVRSEEEALKVANGTPYGLVAGVWTQDVGRSLRLAKRLEAGQVFVNNYGAAGGVELPFGGVKGSGHGREKGLEALMGFSVLKTVAIKHD